MLEMELNLNILQLISIKYFCIHVFSFCHNTLSCIGVAVFYLHGVQRRMISVDNFSYILRLLFFAVLLLYVA